MKRNQGLALVMGLGLALAGCDDNFLSTAPPDQLSTAVFWTQSKDAVLAVNALYPMIYDGEITYLDAASDNAWAQKAFNGWFPVGNGTADAGSGTTGSFWDNSYRAIRRANELLANIDNIPQMNETLRERIKGEARFHRAYHYNYLVNLFGDVPLVLEPIGVDEGKVSRTPRSQVVDQILADLDFAAGVLPESYDGSDKGRVTKGAALAMKARAALYASRWQEAEQAAKAVIDMGRYGLIENYADLFSYEGEDSKEIIWADRRAKDIRSQGAFQWHGPRSLQGGSDVVPLRDIVDAYHMENGLPITDPQSGYSLETQYENRDPRFYATILYPGAEFAGKVFNSLPSSETADRVLNDFNATATGFQQRKYVNEEDVEQPWNSGVDFILIRYADVLLMYAEAKIEQNEIADLAVYDAINEVRERAGMPLILPGKSQEELRQIVRHERRIELAFEGLRLFDIRRWRIAEEVMPGETFGISYQDENGQWQIIPADRRFFDPNRDYLWAIPMKELDLNPELGQNPGY